MINLASYQCLLLITGIVLIPVYKVHITEWSVIIIAFTWR